MRTLFLLGIAVITFLISNSFMIDPTTQIQKPKKTAGKPDESEWEKIHLLIERSTIDTVKTRFERFINDNLVLSNALECDDGNYFGLTPADDYGYQHLVFLEIKLGKIIHIHYDELKPTGKNKRYDLHYNHEMQKSGTSPATAYPIYENQLIKNQDFMKVDAVTGATYSLYRFRMAVSKALETASHKK